jgi:hypothetical protein
MVVRFLLNAWVFFCDAVVVDPKPIRDIDTFCVCCMPVLKGSIAYMNIQV